MVKQRKGIKEELIVPIKNMEPKTNTPTPEQMRIAEILDMNVVDSTIKLKLKQIMDATQRSIDEVYVALHDSDFDVNRAVNLLIEGEDQLADWCTNDKKKKKLAELKEKKEETLEAPMPEKNSFRGRGDNKRRPGRRQDGGKQPQKPQDRQQGPETKARGKRPGFESMVFERSNPPQTKQDSDLLLPVKNQWEKPFLKASGPQDDWDCEEFQGSLSHTQIFTSSKKPEPSKELTTEEPKTPLNSPRSVPLSSLTFTKRDSPVDIRPNVVPAIPSQDPPDNQSGVITSREKPISIGKQGVIPAADYPYRLNLNKPNHQEEKRPPTKIPILPVEMPPELKPSLSFLDIQFGAIDLCSSDASNESQTNLSDALSQSVSTSTIMSPSSCSTTHLANTSISSTSINNVMGGIVKTPTNYSSMAPTTNSMTTQVMNSMNNSAFDISVSGKLGKGNVNNTLSSTNQSINITNTALNSIVNSSVSTSNSISSSSLVSPRGTSSISHLMGQSGMQQTGANMAANSMLNSTHAAPNAINHAYGSTNNQNRFMPSSQAFSNSHLQYGIINPPGSSLGYESRVTPPPSHLPQPHAHLPPYKSPPGIPKGTMVPNLPPGPLVGNQFIVGQGNVPYFPHQIYYYEDMQPVMNSQQQLANMSHPHYDINYQNPPSSRDGVHYNV